MSEILESKVKEEKESGVVADLETPVKNHDAGAGIYNNKVDPLDEVANHSNQELLDPLYSSNTQKAVNTDDNNNRSAMNFASLGPGELLKNARELAQLTKEDIAKELRLSVKHIEYLEQDLYHRFAAVAFYVGYMRNYAKLLDLDPDKMVSKFYAVYKVMPDTGVFKKVPVLTWRDYWPLTLLFSKDKTAVAIIRYVKYVALGAVCTLMLVLLWWLLSPYDQAKVETVVGEINNKDLQKLSPEIVDEVLPSGPVIVKKSDDKIQLLSEGIKLSSADMLIKKTNMIDSYS